MQVVQRQLEELSQAKAKEAEDQMYLMSMGTNYGMAGTYGATPTKTAGKDVPYNPTKGKVSI